MSEHAGPLGAQRRQGFLVGIVPVGGKNNEGIHAALLPGVEQIVHPAVKRLAAHRGVPGVRSLGGGVHAVRDGRRPQDAKTGRKLIGQPLDDYRITAEREMGSVLFAGAYGHQQS